MEEVSFDKNRQHSCEFIEIMREINNIKANSPGVIPRYRKYIIMKLPPLPEDRIIREKLTEYWLQNARMEHAAIGAFARLSLELLSLGSPPTLLKDTTAAQTDEIHHAELCFTLASHYAGEAISPGTYPGIISG
jgi:hypothetical protein